MLKGQLEAARLIDGVTAQEELNSRLDAVKAAGLQQLQALQLAQNEVLQMERVTAETEGQLRFEVLLRVAALAVACCNCQ